MYFPSLIVTSLLLGSAVANPVNSEPESGLSKRASRGGQSGSGSGGTVRIAVYDEDETFMTNVEGYGNCADLHGDSGRFAALKTGPTVYAEAFQGHGCTGTAEKKTLKNKDVKVEFHSSFESIKIVRHGNR
ncbi:MAG: hypothetical protein M1820_006958 [Bogoriella megaspora]|nr:MAG: hypothetical protein M1820_006958 [Bogoriella megaspora]